MRRRLEESDAQLLQVNKVSTREKCDERLFSYNVQNSFQSKSALAKQLDEQKSRLDDETRSRSKLASENRALQQEMTSLQEALEDEADGRSQLQKMLAKANGDAQAWRRKFEGGEGAVKAEEAR